ncbi:hypothetical protein BSL78_01014 [Apostichopus japonicus]|uniref:Uncharacterized protein n=1 Tax=Stichopus japonicus TaxID=307972 RepID=A0A2G8LP19_STIJA|nr:hypothetical protein BSL78_01014 [Apostichopus japonicus]
MDDFDLSAFTNNPRPRRLPGLGATSPPTPGRAKLAPITSLANAPKLGPITKQTSPRSTGSFSSPGSLLSSHAAEQSSLQGQGSGNNPNLRPARRQTDAGSFSQQGLDIASLGIPTNDKSAQKGDLQKVKNQDKSCSSLSAASSQDLGIGRSGSSMGRLLGPRRVRDSSRSTLSPKTLAPLASQRLLLSC